MKNFDDEDYDALDTDVRKLVRWLHVKGYATSDSGDGHSKQDENKRLRAEFVAAGKDCKGCKDARDDGYATPSMEGCTCTFEPRWGDDILDFPHVAIVCPKSRLAAVADELLGHLKLIGIEVLPLTMESTRDEAMIEATYTPTTGTAMIMLTGVTDADLPPWIVGEL